MSRKIIGTMTAEEMLALIDARDDVIPEAERPNVKTVREWARHWGCSENPARRRCNIAVAKGLMKKTTVKVDCGMGRAMDALAFEWLT